MKPIMYSVLLSLLFLFPGRVAAQTGFPPPSPDMNPYLDPAFQDYVETAYGYRNPKNAPKFINDFHDALTSLSPETLKTAQPAKINKLQVTPKQAHAPAPGKTAPDQSRSFSRGSEADVSMLTSVGSSYAPKGPGQYYKVTFANERGPLSAYVNPLDPNALSGFKAGDYVFITVLPRTEDYTAVIRALSGTGFKFAGEKTCFTGGGKKTFLLGWAPYSKLESIYKHPQVRRVAIEKKAAGVPLRTRVRFTLRAPGGPLSGVFVSDFIRQLSAGTGFASEIVFRLPQNAGNSKFTAFDVTGSLPVDMVGEISRSPFVAAVEFTDNSL